VRGCVGACVRACTKKLGKRPPRARRCKGRLGRRPALSGGEDAGGWAGGRRRWRRQHHQQQNQASSSSGLTWQPRRPGVDNLARVEAGRGRERHDSDVSRPLARPARAGERMSWRGTHSHRGALGVGPAMEPARRRSRPGDGAGPPPALVGRTGSGESGWETRAGVVKGPHGSSQTDSQCHGHTACTCLSPSNSRRPGRCSARLRWSLHGPLRLGGLPTRFCRRRQVRPTPATAAGPARPQHFQVRGAALSRSEETQRQSLGDLDFDTRR
jgi:hypothetical protein